MVDDASIPQGDGAPGQGQSAGELPPPRVATNVPPPDPFASPPPAPSYAQTGMAQLRLLNPIMSVIDAVSSMPGNSPTPGYSPLDTIKGTPHEGDDLSIYAGSHNEAYTRALMAQKDREGEDRRTVAASGWTGVAMGIGAGFLDPTLLLPVLGEERLGKIGAMAAYGAAQVWASETALQASQVDRPWQESAGNIASATILGGVLGKAAEMLTKPEMAAATKALDDVRPRVDAATGDLIMPTPLEPIDRTRPIDWNHAPDEITQEPATEPQILRKLGPTPYIEGKPGVTPGTIQGGTDLEKQIQSAGVAPQAPAEGAVPGGLDRDHAVSQAINTEYIKSQYENGLISAPERDARLAAIEHPTAQPTAPTVEAKPTVPAEVPETQAFKEKMALAKSQGYDTKTTYYHGSGKDFEDWTQPYGGEKAVFLTKDPNIASIYAQGKNAPNVIPLLLNKGKTKTVDWSKTNVGEYDSGSHYSGLKMKEILNKAKSDGYDTIIIKNINDLGSNGALQTQIAVLNPIGRLRAKFGAAFNPAMAASGNMLSAAQTDIRQLVLKGGLGVEKISGIRKADLESPNLAIYNASSVEARRAMRDVSEFGGLFKDAGEGQTAPFGSPLESQARVLKGQAMTNTAKIIEDAWFKHQAAEAKQGTVKGFFMKQGVGTAPEKLDFGDFDRAVGVAMHNGDAHLIPEVQAAADKLRSGVADPIKEALQNTKDRDGKPMLADEMDAPKGAKSFFPLIYNRDAWIARRPENERVLTDYYESEQAIKAAAKERLQDLSTRREALGERISKMDETTDPLIKDQAVKDHAALGEKIEEEIQNWKGNTTREAVAALKKRDLAAQTVSTAGTKPAADAVDLAVKRILASDRDLPRQELASRAQQTVDRIIGSPDGRLAYDDAGTFGFKGGSEDARGSLLARRMPIDVNELIDRGLVNTSATHGMASLARTLIPDMLLTKRFGDVGMTDVMRRIDEEYAAKAGANDKANAALQKEKDAVVENLAAARDRLRGVYGWDPSPHSLRYTGMVRDMQNINGLRALGSSVPNRATDASNAIARYGFMNVFKDAWAPFFQGLIDPELRHMVRDQARDAGVGIDGLLGHMRANIYDVNTALDPGNKFSRGLAYFTDKSMIANVHGPWTDINKELVFNVAQGELGRIAARVVAGTSTKRDLIALDGLSIDQAMAERIAKQYDQYAVTVSGRKFADAPNWTDRGAKMAFEAAMSREANATVLTAGIGQRPLLMDKNIGRLGLQFKGFTAAAHENILLSSLQKRDMRTVEGFFSAIAMGMVGTAIYKVLSGQEISNDPREWIKEGLDRSQMGGWFAEANNHLSRLTSGSVDYNRLYRAQTVLTRHRDLSLEGELGGPTVDLAEKLAKAGEHAIAGKSQRTGRPYFTGTDVHNVRQGFPWQNMWFFRRLLDQAEESVSNAFGLKPKPKQAVH